MECTNAYNPVSSYLFNFIDECWKSTKYKAKIHLQFQSLNNINNKPVNDMLLTRPDRLLTMSIFLQWICVPI